MAGGYVYENFTGRNQRKVHSFQSRGVQPACLRGGGGAAPCGRGGNRGVHGEPDGGRHFDGLVWEKA